MRPLPQSNGKCLGKARFGFIALLAAGAWLQGCGGGGAGTPPPPPPPSIVVTVTPVSGSVVLGNQLTFTATVTNATDTSVSWSVSGIAGGNSTVGTITTAGVYAAPADLPATPAVQVTATSRADTKKSSSASVTITSDIALALSPNPASVELGATQTFQASVTSSGHPDTTMRWSLSGAACPSACGTVDSSGHELARQATAVARVRCLGAESRWENGEIWTETRFEVVEQSKGELPGIVTIRMLVGKRRQSPFANRGCSPVSRGRGSLRVPLGA
ncbi:MAG TPA: hypothetical protein VH114_06775 [Candidatus Acidoferrum sp.]|nr:hypothetical protein [Candidatus Acidoferrum sp.]